MKQFSVENISSDLEPIEVFDKQGNKKIFKLKKLSYREQIKLYVSGQKLIKMNSDENNLEESMQIFVNNFKLLYPESEESDFDIFSDKELADFFKFSLSEASGKSIKDLEEQSTEYKKKAKNVLKKK